jgi:hypothetical protein
VKKTDGKEARRTKGKDSGQAGMTEREGLPTSGSDMPGRIPDKPE